MSKKKQEPTKIDELNKMIETTEVDRSAEYKEFIHALQKSLFYFVQDNVFVGNLLQELNFKISYHLPTAALCYDKKRQTFEILINPTFFLKHTLEQQIAILHHELLHFTNAHVFRFGMDNTNAEDKKRQNIAADMAINQYIKHLPEGCIDVKFFKDDKMQPFPLLMPAETYEKLLKDNPDAMKNALKAMKDAGIQVSDNGNGEGVFDSHDWEALSEEEKRQMADEIKKLVKRTMEKTQYGRDDLPGGIKEFLEEMEVFLQKMNYKRILQECIKKSASSVDREGTWKRPNKRYGVVAPGTTIGKLPQLVQFIDSSGSMSVKEINEGLRVVDGFLKAGSRNCLLGFWHTALYNIRKYKLGQKVKKEDIESGGTDMTEVCDYINKHKPDLSIIWTDGYYNTRTIPKGEVVVIISEGGSIDHPLKDKRNVKTIPMKGLTGVK